MRQRLFAILAILGLLVTPAAAQITNAATTNGSVTITTGSTFQQVLAAVTSATGPRRSLTIQNNNSVNTTDSCWVFVGSGNATKATSILLLNGQAYTRFYPFVPSDPIQATCLSTSDTLYVDTQ